MLSQDNYDIRPRRDRFAQDPRSRRSCSALWNGSLAIPSWNALWGGSPTMSRPEHASEWIARQTEAVARFGVDPSRHRAIARFGFDIALLLSPINFHSRHPKYQPPLVSHQQQSQRKPRRRSNRRSPRCSRTTRSRRDGCVARRAFEHASPQKPPHAHHSASIDPPYHTSRCSSIRAAWCPA